MMPKLSAAQAALVAKWEAEAERKNQLEALVQHCRLFHFTSSSPKPVPPGPERENLLDWFAALSVQERASALTTDEVEWSLLLLRMLEKRGEDGGNFVVLVNQNDESAGKRQRRTRNTKERLLLAEMDPLIDFRCKKTKRATNGETLSGECRKAFVGIFVSLESVRRIP
jgi:hypothetical protein